MPQEMPADFSALKTRLVEISDLSSAASLLYWDQATHMPSGGAVARGRQLATLRRLAHERLTDPRLGELLVRLESLTKELPTDSFECALLRVTRHDYDRATRVSSEFTARFSNHCSDTYEVWIKAKADNDFKRLIPYLEKTVDLSREYAACFPGYQHIADPLIDLSDEGASTLSVRALFDELRRELVPLVRAIGLCPQPDESQIAGRFDLAAQAAFGEDVIKRFGYDFSRGRQDKTHHPFMIKFSLDDVRITTRFKEDDVTDALFSTLHEAGHALYEQGIDAVCEGTPLAAGVTAGVHESQSRLWENLVGRSRGFWEYFYPKLAAVFPEPLRRVTPDEFYRAINRVVPSLIRTDADEVTYNLHVMIRFDMELDLLAGRLRVKDMPEAWNTRYQQDLGVTPPEDRQGVMQDVHWHTDFIGGQFQCYTIGNILSAQFFDAAVLAIPSLPAEIARGEFTTLRAWLKQNIHRFGKQLPAETIIQNATGSALTIAPYVRYLKKKYGELYGLKL